MVTRRTNQGGSIATFTIIGIIMSVSLIGAVYLLNQHNQKAHEELAATKYEQKQQDSKKPSSGSAEPNIIKVSQDSESDLTNNESKNSIEIPVTGSSFSYSDFISLYLVTFFLMSFLTSRHKLSLSL